jgi:hypothetical protein
MQLSTEVSFVGKQVRIERRIWDGAGFVRTGEVMSGDIGKLEQLADNFGRLADRYLKGPVPWAWIAAAYQLRGKSLVVGLCIWRMSGATKSRTICLGNDELESLGVDRAAKIARSRRPGGCWPD